MEENEKQKSQGSASSQRGSNVSDKSQNTKSMQEEFDFYISQAKKKALNLEDYEERGRACAWIKSLSDSPLDQNVLDYAKFLLWAIHCCKLLGPFSNLPPATVAPLPPGIAAKAFDLDANTIAREMLTENDGNCTNGTVGCLPKVANGYYEYTVKPPPSVNMSYLKEDDDTCTYQLTLKEDMNKCEKKATTCKKESVCPTKTAEEKVTPAKDFANKTCLKSQNQCFSKTSDDKECLRSIMCSRVTDALGKMFKNKTSDSSECPSVPAQNSSCKKCSTPGECNKEQVDICKIINSPMWAELMRQARCSQEEKEDPWCKSLDASRDDCDSEQMDFDKYTTDEYQRMMASERRKFWQPHGVDPRMLKLRGLYNTPEVKKNPNPRVDHDGSSCCISEPQSVSFKNCDRTFSRSKSNQKYPNRGNLRQCTGTSNKVNENRNCMQASCPRSDNIYYPQNRTYPTRGASSAINQQSQGIQQLKVQLNARRRLFYNQDNGENKYTNYHCTVDSVPQNQFTTQMVRYEEPNESNCIPFLPRTQPQALCHETGIHRGSQSQWENSANMDFEYNSSDEDSFQNCHGHCCKDDYNGL